MADETSLQKQFLIAMPGLGDSNFDHAVALMCEHNDQGALGLVINRPTDLNLSAMLEHMQLDHAGMASDAIVYWGGPVSPERGFVIHNAPGQWESTLRIDENLYITTSRDVLAAIGRGEGPDHSLVTLGYAGWGAGQLEGEILGNAWLSTPISPDILFKLPAAERWQAATQLLGLDVKNLASQVGHA